MKPNLYSLPEAVPGEDIVHVTLKPHFDPIEGCRRFIVAAGVRVGEIISRALPDAPPSVLSRVSVTLAFGVHVIPVERLDWNNWKPKAGVHVVIRIVPADPGAP